ncbi:hemerythrin domain-containing protein [Rubellimicrobium arenae]|uniref:hemerythrin domain-containing protein n=1 Tax=Rubellimicrobium arenae TaxID=2817372 RepID=UPI001B317B68|nr:hemerythrin domain-containing protein [Rubellimicrobium arenae]
MDHPLETRTGLPDALRVLLADHPRDGWARDPNFAGLVEMWLDRHLLFRRLMAAMRADAESVLDGRMDPRAWGGRTSRLGGHFVGDLHGHHRVEDDHYFPLLVTRDPRLEQGFAILDRDHHALDGHLNAFVEEANGALRVLDAPGFATGAGRFHAGLIRLERFLDRHLTDEEELIVPVILRDGPDAVGG